MRMSRQMYVGKPGLGIAYDTAREQIKPFPMSLSHIAPPYNSGMTQVIKYIREPPETGAILLSLLDL